MGKIVCFIIKKEQFQLEMDNFFTSTHHEMTFFLTDFERFPANLAILWLNLQYFARNLSILRQIEYFQGIFHDGVSAKISQKQAKFVFLRQKHCFLGDFYRKTVIFHENNTFLSVFSRKLRIFNFNEKTAKMRQKEVFLLDFKLI